MYVIGIDPGISGAICFFEDGKLLMSLKCQQWQKVKKIKKQVNGNQLLTRLNHVYLKLIMKIFPLLWSMFQLCQDKE